MTEVFDQLLEPTRVTTGFDSDVRLASELLIKCADIITLLIQLEAFNLALRSVHIRDDLLPRMKIDSDLYCHCGRLLLQLLNPRVSLAKAHRRRWLLCIISVRLLVD